MTIAQLITEKLDALPPDKQQEVLDFVEFLQSRLPETEEPGHQFRPISALEVAGDLVGCVKGGPPDLSTNPIYMDGFGQE